MSSISSSTQESRLALDLYDIMGLVISSPEEFDAKKPDYLRMMAHIKRVFGELKRDIPPPEVEHGRPLRITYATERTLASAILPNLDGLIANIDMLTHSIVAQMPIAEEEEPLIREFYARAWSAQVNVIYAGVANIQFFAKLVADYGDSPAGDPAGITIANDVLTALRPIVGYVGILGRGYFENEAQGESQD